jgi:hypothetical protein
VSETSFVTFPFFLYFPFIAHVSLLYCRRYIKLGLERMLLFLLLCSFQTIILFINLIDYNFVSVSRQLWGPSSLLSNGYLGSFAGCTSYSDRNLIGYHLLLKEFFLIFLSLCNEIPGHFFRIDHDNFLRRSYSFIVKTILPYIIRASFHTT